MRDFRYRESFSEIKLDQQKSDEIVKNLDDYYIEKTTGKKPFDKNKYYLIALVALVSLLILFFIGKALFKKDDIVTKPVTKPTTTVAVVTKSIPKNEEFKIDELFRNTIPSEIIDNSKTSELKLTLTKEQWDKVYSVIKKYNYIKSENKDASQGEISYILLNDQDNLKLSLSNDKYLVIDNGEKTVIESPGIVLSELRKVLETEYKNSLKRDSYKLIKKDLNIITDKDSFVTNEMVKDQEIKDDTRSKLFNDLNDSSNITEAESVVKTDKYVSFSSAKGKILKIFDSGIVELTSSEYPMPLYFKVKNINILKDLSVEINAYLECLVNFSFDSMSFNQDDFENKVKLTQEEAMDIMKLLQGLKLPKLDINTVSLTNPYNHTLINSTNLGYIKIYDNKYMYIENNVSGAKNIQAFGDGKISLEEVTKYLDKFYNDKVKNEGLKVINDFIIGIGSNEYVVSKIGGKENTENKVLKFDRLTEVRNLLSKIKDVNPANSIKDEDIINSIKFGNNALFISKENIVVIKYGDGLVITKVDKSIIDGINKILDDETSYY